ncbi:DNA-binding domain-containing protein [Thermophagus sp. OGC60D27]|uniref:DNA-binding domain-containing protein n=1 Tax=Thermophagus sp. OGC60D27 TaxID=3458415 RepID=UPI004037C2B9
MAVKYGLVENLLTDDPNDYRAVTTDNETDTEEDIVDDMVERGSTVTRPDILSVLEEYKASIRRRIAMGRNVNTPLFEAYHTISGVFNGLDDTFNRSRHKVKLSMNPGKVLKDAMSSVEVQRVDIDPATPDIQRVEDLRTHSINEEFSSGDIISIRGSNLKFDESDPDQGVFFIDDSGNATKATNVAKNKPSELLVFAPEGLSGSYHIEVRAILPKRKTLTINRFEKELSTVE